MSDETDNHAKPDDQDWLDTLAGKPSSHIDPSARQDAQRLRTALLQHQLNTKATTAADFDKLRARLQQEKALKPEKTRFFMWTLLDYLKVHFQPIVATMALIFISVSLVLWLPTPDSPLIPKNTLDAITLPIVVAQPEQAAAALQARLASLQQSAHMSQQANYWQVTLTLSGQLRDADLENILALLSDYGSFMLGSDKTTFLVQFFPPDASYVYSLQVAAPSTEAELIQQELQQLGIAVQRQALGNIVQLDIHIPLPLTQERLFLLDSYGWEAQIVERFAGKIRLQLHP